MVKKLRAKDGRVFINKKLTEPGRGSLYKNLYGVGSYGPQIIGLFKSLF